jgi:hypothetical protein
MRCDVCMFKSVCLCEKLCLNFNSLSLCVVMRDHSTGTVPKEIKGKVRELVVQTGPLAQFRFLPGWKKAFTDNSIGVRVNRLGFQAAYYYTRVLLHVKSHCCDARWP